jgi:hypothetical protein
MQFICKMFKREVFYCTNCKTCKICQYETHKNWGFHSSVMLRVMPCVVWYVDTKIMGTRLFSGKQWVLEEHITTIFRLPWKGRQYVPLKHWYPLIKLGIFINHKAIMGIIKLEGTVFWVVTPCSMCCLRIPTLRRNMLTPFSGSASTYV